MDRIEKRHATDRKRKQMYAINKALKLNKNSENEIESELGYTVVADCNNKNTTECDFIDSMKMREDSPVDEFIDCNIDSMKMREDSPVDEFIDCNTDDDNFDDSSELKVSNTISEALRQWALDTKVTHSVIDALLKKLKPFHPDLPVTAKSLLKVKYSLKKKIKKFSPNEKDNSQFVYIGIASQLQKIVNITLHPDKTLHLLFHVDGLSVFKSSSKEFWPILGKVYIPDSCFYKPFVIAVYFGSGKPSSPQLYLDDFVKELNDLLSNGVTINNQHFSINIKCFICDRPARSYIKCIKGHCGYSSCERCYIKGDYVNKRIIFQSVDCGLRTDESFRLFMDPDHHLGKSPLINVPQLDMIQDFVLDFMHLGCLGITKKLLCDYWVNSKEFKLSRDNLLRTSQRLVNLSDQVTSEFQRTTRSLGDIQKWKATEFRFFCLYSGPLVLKGILSDKMYDHFLLFHVACRILSSVDFLQHLDHAKLYLKKFVQLFGILYSKSAWVSNVHNIIHLADDVKRMNCPLSDISAFEFESYLGYLKDTLKSGYKPLTQLCNRLEESFAVNSDEVLNEEQYSILNIRKKSDCLFLKKVLYKGFQLSITNPNNVILLQDLSILKINQMTIQKNGNLDDVIVSGKRLDKIGSAYSYPSDSALLDIFKVKENSDSTNYDVHLSDIKSKLILLEIYELPGDDKELFVIPLLH